MANIPRLRAVLMHDTTQSTPSCLTALIYSILFSNSQDHKNCGEMTEIEAKVKYVKLARSLRTYGVSFFLVKVRLCLCVCVKH
jgi:hypothetical protein